MFDEQEGKFAQVRERLSGLLSPSERAAARQTVLNAHFTDPRIAESMWTAVERLGFTGGPVLEPGCGSGVFLATAPRGAEPTGVEVDPVTAEIAAHLNPAAQVRAESFADSRFDTRFAAVVGNVPFGKIALHDPDGNAGNYTLHNHFVVKSLQHTAPGGIVAVLSSRYLLDASNPAARQTMAELGDLLGAVRLPAGTHRAVAGTDVVTDLLVFQRHLTDEVDRPEPTWIRTADIDVDGDQVAINEYFLEHPEHLLGTLASQPYPGPGLLVVARGSLEAVPVAVDVALQDITERALLRGARIPEQLDLTARRPSPQTGRFPSRGQGEWDGHIAWGDEGFTVVRAGIPAELAVPRAQHAEMRALIELRDGARELLQREAAGAPSEELDADRTQLRGRYEAYVAQWGPINRFTQRRTGRVDEHGNEKFSRVAPAAVVRLRSDPFGPLVAALEIFDESTQAASPAQILTERVLEPRALVAFTDDPDEAIAVCMDRHGRLSLEDLAELMDRTPDELPDVLGDRVFEDPSTGRLLMAAEYLSGDVRVKLEHARGLLDERPELLGHVQALTAVLPTDVPLDEIEARLGAAWIDADAHRQFLVEILDDNSVYVEHPGGSTWAVRGNKHTVAATVEWGTERVSATEIAEQLMRQKPIVVRDRVDGDKLVVNAMETAAAIDKGEALQDRFAEWVWEDPQRAMRLAAEYNRRFNSEVLRDYSAAGERLTLPGLAKTFTPRPHQRSGVARMLGEPTVGLFHEVGAGKTASMAIGTMELRRLGMVKKPAVVVPNHMLEQFSREWLALYPQARLLAASSQQLTRDRRREFVARIATHDWDAVVLTRTAFERLALRPENAAAFIESQLAELEEQVEQAKATTGRVTVKGLEAQLQRERERAKKLMDTPTDPGIHFEDSGIDYVVVDEAHDYKNLRTASKIPGASIDGSARATDLESKLEYLRGRHGERVATFATATPIANSITEAHVMMRYLRPDRLRAAGIGGFDSWAATFGRTVSGVEITADGAGFHQKTRFAKFQNVPEMLSTWHVFADVKTAEDLQLPRPDLAINAAGKREPATVVVPPSPAVSRYVRELGRRAEAVRSGGVDPRHDNMLKISGDGRKAALDMRLIDGPGVELDGVTKLHRVADQVAADWMRHKDARYLDPATGQPSPTPGALQIVFCDLSTPREGWNAYDELRELLVDRGLPREGVRFIHEAKSDAEKARLFAACRSGDVSVIIGSTARMGVGTNIQSRAASLHHIDCPWRPADVQQRDGRALRQGNQNDEISIYRYVTENSFDAFSWQTVARKWGFTQQVMRGDRSLRTVEDVSQEELTAHQVVALASGNPLLLEKHQADVDVAHLQRIQRNHQRSQHQLQARRASELEAAGAAERDAQRLTTALTEEVTSTRGERFSLLVDGQRYTDRGAAADALSRHIDRQITALRSPRGPLGIVGELGGVQLRGELHPYPDGLRVVTVALGDLPVPAVDGEVRGLAGVPAGKLLRSLEHRINTLEQRRDARLADHEQHRKAAHQAAEQLGRPFKRADELDAARRRAQALDRQIAEQAKTTDASIPERQAELVRLTTEAARLDQRIAEIPIHALDRINQIAAQIDDLQRDQNQPSLQAGPEHYRQAAAQTYGERIKSLTAAHHQIAEDLQRRTGHSLEDLERQRQALDRRRDEVDEHADQIRGAIVEASLEQVPAWLTEQIGPPPTDANQRALWQKAVRTAVTAQLQIDPGADLNAGLPADPTPAQRPHVTRATKALQQLAGGAGRER